MSEPRIVSLLGSATEIVYALGLEQHLVAISHECDYPPDALRLPRVSAPRFDPAGLDSGEIDAAVRRCMEEFGSVYRVDVEALRRLEPTLILTQAVCEVCAVPTGSVEEAIGSLPGEVEVVSLDAHTLEGILGTMQQVASAAGAPERGEALVVSLRRRLGDVRDRVEGAERPRVLLLEWLDPPFAPGHWVPEMVEWAGGINLLGRPGQRSVEVAWREVIDLDPDVLLVEPCGYDAKAALSSRARCRSASAQSPTPGHGCCTAPGSAAPVPGWSRESRRWLRCSTRSTGPRRNSNREPAAGPDPRIREARMNLSTRLHGIADYLFALVLFVVPVAGGWAGTTAGAVMIVAGVLIASAAVVTDFEAGVVRRLQVPVHLWLDGLVGLLLALSPWLFVFYNDLWLPHLLLGSGLIVMAFFTNTVPGYDRRRSGPALP